MKLKSTTLGVATNAIIYIPSFVKIGQTVQKAKLNTQTHRDRMVISQAVGLDSQNVALFNRR
jgi:hypothetical protein